MRDRVILRSMICFNLLQHESDAMLNANNLLPLCLYVIWKSVFSVFRHEYKNQFF